MTGIELWISSLLAALGAWVNAVAGGGTFLTFPMLTFIGLTALQANILSTIALWPGIVASAFAYRHERKSLTLPIKPLLTVSLIGSAIGTGLLLYLPETYFEHAVPWLLLFATLLLSFGKKIKTYVASRPQGNSHSLPLILCSQFLIAIYGGYFGAGIGILMLAMIQFLPLASIHQSNALKALLGSTINAVAFFIFIFSGHVIWSIAIWMLIGGIIGGYVGTRIALKINPNMMRMIVLVIAWITTVIYLYKSVANA